MSKEISEQRVAIIVIVVVVLFFTAFIWMLKWTGNIDLKREQESGVRRVNSECIQFDFEGHKYLTRTHGTIVHAESCSCKGVK